MRRGALRLMAIGSYWIALQACATYDGLSAGPTGGDAGSTSTGGDFSASGDGAGGTKPSGAGNVSGGSTGASGSSGKAGSTGDGGTIADGGTTSAAGASMDAGAPGMGGVSASGEGGAGGATEADCSSVSPDASCTCAANGGHDYWFCSTYLTFAAAEKKCTAAGMHLPKVESKAEDDWLFDTSTGKTMGEYFLGATDASSPNEWSWLAGGKFWSGVADGTPTGYASWSANEPNDSGDCLVVQGNGPWDDRICTDQRKYICEAP